jgi:hypothetical protein
VTFPGRKEQEGMRKIKLAVAMAAVLAGVLTPILGAGTANASTYTVSYIDRCMMTVAEHNQGGYPRDCFQMGTYSTYSQTQVWINGKVFCKPYSGSVGFSWCGVGGGNGTGALNIGGNFTMSGIGGLYERMNIYAGGGGCSTWGSNSSTNGIYKWWNDFYGPGIGGVGGGGVSCEWAD